MALLEILEFPDPRLRTRAEPVDTVTEVTRKLIEDMFETMYNAPGIGLAATQVNVHKRILVMDVSEEKIAPWYSLTQTSPRAVKRWRTMTKAVCLCRVFLSP